MSKHRKKRSKKSGLPPGTLLHIGEQNAERVKITLTRFSETQYNESEAKTVEECLPTGDGQITWITVHGVHDAEVILKIGEQLRIHPLNQEDIMNTDHRPKLEDHGEYLFIVFKQFEIVTEKPIDVTARQVSLILGKDYVVAFLELTEDVFSPVRERFRTNLERYVKMGAGYLAYCLIDVIVDNYFTILERFDDEIDVMEEKSSSEHITGALQELQSLRREIISVRRGVWPLREVISAIQKRESPLIAESAAVYYSDIYDHVIQVMDTTETFREILSNIFDIYLSSINNRMNEIMKVLTIIATVMLPLTFVVGLYGMNFKYMPELKTHWGYPAVLFFMAAIATTMLTIFKKKKWF